jgi:hypothetical protein
MHGAGVACSEDEDADAGRNQASSKNRPFVVGGRNDCDAAVDALKELRKVAAFSVSQNEPSADIGEPL